MGPQVNQDDIARLAYQLWLERGCPQGSPEVDWERATQLLSFGSSEQAPSGVPTSNDDAEIDALSTGLADSMSSEAELGPDRGDMRRDFDSTAENLPEGTNLVAPGTGRAPRKPPRTRGPRTKS